MSRLIRFFVGHPRLILAFLVFVTAVAAIQLDRLRIVVSAESMLERGTEAWDYFVETEETFGGEDLAVVILHDQELLQPDKLSRIKQVIESLEQLPYIVATSSLFTVPNIKNVDGSIESAPYFETFPETREEADELIAQALSNPLVAGNLMSANGQTIAINLTIARDSKDDDFDHTATLGIEHVIAPLRERVEKVYQVGSAAVRSELNKKVREDQRVFMPISVAVLLLTLVFSLRRVSAAILPLMTASISVVWTLGFMAWVGIPMNIMTSIVPALVIIIGSTEDIHLLAEYSSGIRQGMDRMPAIRRMGDGVGMAVLLTFLTTYVGFMSVAVNDIQLLRQFGIAASSGLLFNFLITIMLVPVALRYFGHRKSRRLKKGTQRTWFQDSVVKLVDFSLNHRLLMLVLTAAIVVAAVVSATQLRINNDITDYLADDSPQRWAMQAIHRDLSGVNSFSIVVDSGIDNTFLQVKYLEQILAIQKFLERTGKVDATYSFANFISLINSVMDEEYDPDFPLPEGDDIVREYTLFVSAKDVRGFVSPDYARARILVRHNIQSSEELNQLTREIRDYLDRNVDPGLRVEITGKSVLSNLAVEKMAYGQLQSLLLVGGVIIMLVSALFISFRAGLIALLPNIVPVVVLFGVMALLGIPLNAGTSMVAAIALGICVDDTMHVMSRFHEELKVQESRMAALQAMIRAEVVPIVATSVALAAGFGVFAISNFQPVVYFGLLSAMVILIALLATFVLTPLLLSSTELLTVWDLLSYKVQKEALQKSPLFQGMYVWQIKKILLASEVRPISKGSHIITEGEMGTEMYVVLQGRTEARKVQADGMSKGLRVFGVGDLFGEVGPLSGGTRTADVVALEDAQLLVLSWARVDQLTRRFPILAFRLFRNLTKIIGARLRHTSEYKVTAKG